MVISIVFLYYKCYNIRAACKYEQFFYTFNELKYLSHELCLQKIILPEKPLLYFLGGAKTSPFFFDKRKANKKPFFSDIKTAFWGNQIAVRQLFLSIALITNIIHHLLLKVRRKKFCGVEIWAKTILTYN